MKHLSFLWICFMAFGMISLSVAWGAEEGLYNAHGKRDPFVPLVTLTSHQASGLMGIENLEDIVIEGIVCDPKNGSVLIANGTVLKEGEEQGNIKVVKVESNGAVISINQNEGFVPLYKDKTVEQK